jgi:hypothetical protein
MSVRWIATWSLIVLSSAEAAEIPADPSTYRALAASLMPGDTLLLAPGNYVECLELAGVHGEEGSPIVIAGAGAGSTIFTAQNCFGANPPFTSVTIKVSDSSHLVFRDFEIDGQGLAVDGIEAGYGNAGATHHITIERLYIHDNDTSNQVNCISSFAAAWDWVIRENRLERCGLGMYLGDSDGSDPFIRGTIEHNLIADPVGYGMQIKHQAPRPTLPGMPGDGSVTLVRHNVFSKAENAAGGADARPNLLVGHWPLFGDGLNDRYEIYGNVFFENASNVEPLFQGEGNVAFHDNLLINTYLGPGAWIRPHNDVPKEIVLYRNTFLTSATAISMGGGDPTFRQVAIGNAVYSDGAPAIDAADTADNVTGSVLDAANVFANTDPMLGTIDLYPTSEVLRGPALDLTGYEVHVDHTLDFNGAVHDGTWRGAYAGFGANPGWAVERGIKPRARGMDAGGETDAGLEPDAAESDAGAPPMDAGADAGAADVAGADAASMPDPEEEDEGGCGCAAERRSSSTIAVTWPLVVALVCRRRRRCTLSIRG